MKNNSKINTADIIAKKRQNNNKLFESHRQNLMPKIEAIQANRNKDANQSSDTNLSHLISEAHSLINTEHDRNCRNLETVRQHSEQLKEDDIVEKYFEAEQELISKIDGIEQKRQELNGIVADIGTRINQIIADVVEVDGGESREFVRPNDTPAAYGGPNGMVKVDKKKDPDGMKAFENALGAKAASIGFPPSAVAKAMKNDD